MGDQERQKWQYRLERLKREGKKPAKGQENRKDFPADYKRRLELLRQKAKGAAYA